MGGWKVLSYVIEGWRKPRSCVCQLMVKVCERAGQWQGPCVDRYVPGPGHLQPVLPFNVMVGHCLGPAQPSRHTTTITLSSQPRTVRGVKFIFQINFL